ncbi:MAG: hypothetical protein AABW54_02190 [Candidatus Micrarchaeota archaeon]
MPALEIPLQEELQVEAEPVHGCKRQCSRCVFHPVPRRLAFMTPEAMRTSLTTIARINPSLKRLVLLHGGRGEPLEHPSLAELNKTALETLKELGVEGSIRLLWGGSGVKSPEELAERTRNAHDLLLTIDGQHVYGEKKLLFGTPKRPKQPGYALVQDAKTGVIRRVARASTPPAKQEKQALLAMLEKVQWGLQANRQNGVRLIVNFTREKNGSSSRFIRTLEKLAQRQGIRLAKYWSDERGKNELAIIQSPLYAKGAETGRKTVHDALILHDGTVTTTVPAASNARKRA